MKDQGGNDVIQPSKICNYRRRHFQMHMLYRRLVLCAFTHIREPDHNPIAKEGLAADSATD